MRHWFLLFKMARRNLRRNTRRTLLGALAVGVGLAALIFVDALTIGMVENMIRLATDTFLGHGQIHAEGFRSTLEISQTIRNREEVIARLKEEPDLKTFAERAQAFAMIASPANSNSILLYGIAPSRERDISKLDEVIQEGAYLSDDETGKILVGRKLAETLEVGIGDRVVVTSAMAGTGELAQGLFRVGGIYRFGNREMDDTMAFIRLPEAQGLLGLGNDAHEIALAFHDLHRADRANGFWKRHAQGGNEALSWRDLIPQLDATLEMSKYGTAIVGALLFGVVALGIVNTLFMSLYERMFEFGVLRAVGTRPLSMVVLILFEAVALSLLSIAVGSAIGLAVTGWVAQGGIDYSGIEYAGITFQEPIRPVLQLHQFVVFPVWVLLFTLLAGLYPAFYAARLTPVRAMRRSF